MPALLPDIFTAAIKGYEDANNANWQDLKNYEAIEAARTANDTANLGLLGAIEDYGNNREISNAAGTQANIAALLLRAAAPAQLNQAGSNAIVTGTQLGALQANQPALGQAISNQVAAYADGTSTDARMKRGQNAVIQETAPLVLGAFKDQTKGTANAASILAKNLPNQATQNVTLSNTNYGANVAAGQVSEAASKQALENMPVLNAAQMGQVANSNYVQNQSIIAASEQKLQTLQAQYSALAERIQQHNLNAAAYAKNGLSQMARNEQANGALLQQQQAALLSQIQAAKQDLANLRSQLGSSAPAAPLINMGQ